MSKSLVILEAPGKVKKVQRILGSDYRVLASAGHIADLPSKGLNVDIKKDFKPTYEVYPEKKDIVKNIINEAKKADIVYLMTDSDREGTAIAWHISNQLPANCNYKRAITGSITKEAILKGISDAHDIDMDMVASYEARRILDRLVGYKCSYVTKQATGGPSAGRTQSAGLRILAERELEIRNFVPVVYWPIKATLITERKELIEADIKKPKALDISTKEEAEKICERLKKGPVKVSKFDKKDVKLKPQAPFTTSSLYQSAGGLFGWKAEKTGKVAQKLYEAGAITYHRTDSKFMVPEFVTSVRDYLSSNFDSKYLSSKAYVYGKTKGAQEAHEACRCTDVSVTSFTSAGLDEKRLYEMIWKRTVASQMSEVEVRRISSEFSCDDYVLGANGSKLLFDGWRKVWDYGSLDDRILPDLTVGEAVDVVDIKTERKETQPPKRYTEASFTKKLEEMGIGRPSTYASIPKTLVGRGYIESGKSITVTDLGLKVTDFLIKAEFCFVDLSFTSAMEEKLDLIASQKVTRTDVLKEFWEQLKKDLEKAKSVHEQTRSKYPCEQCKANGREGSLVLRHSRYGSFFSCTNYKDKDNPCVCKMDVGKNGEPIEKVQKEKKYSDIPCPKCGARLVERPTRKGSCLGCEKYPKCQGLYDLEGNEIVFKKKTYKKKYKKKATKKKKKSKKKKSRKK